MVFGTLPLNDGKQIPAIAFGTGSIYKGTDVSKLVHQALDAGFWHIDTAQFYATEVYVGQVIRESGLARSELYVTTKYGQGNVREVLDKSLSDLGLTYVDLYLIHQPRFVHDIDTVWREFEIIKKEGKAKSIGVSNFDVDQLQQLALTHLVVPAVNQIELHPYNYAQKKSVIDWAAQNGVVIEAYSSLSSITKFPGGPVDAPVAAAAVRLGITPTQVLLSWVRAKGAVIVTTTSSKQRLEEYLAVGVLPALSEADIAAIDEAGAKGPPAARILGYAINLDGMKRLAAKLVLILTVQLITLLWVNNVMGDAMLHGE
ncbi:Aldo/keto reductase [Roridomyces roridus]|uniref:Aldo/keto reductase n=1 Tax=Roridomyces roridus TaxID=1738132 RepID=A0AAD7C1X2_9AGAR|nr:Aldo/keto reductase [Roridomyces roridus]